VLARASAVATLHAITVDTIAFYGTLMRGMGALESLGLEATLTYTGDCTLPGTLYDLGSYPGLKLGSSRSGGELFEFSDADVLAKLDVFEGVAPVILRALSSSASECSCRSPPSKSGSTATISRCPDIGW